MQTCDVVDCSSEKKEDVKEMNTMIEKLQKQKKRLFRLESRARLVSMLPSNLNRVQFEIQSNNALKTGQMAKRTLGFMLSLAYTELFPGKRLKSINSLFDGVYYIPLCERGEKITPISTETCQVLQKKILEYIFEDMSIFISEVENKEAIAIMEAEGRTHEVNNLRACDPTKKLQLATYRGYRELILNGEFCKKNHVKYNYALIPFKKGIFLHHSNRSLVKSVADENNLRPMYKMIREQQKWTLKNYNIEYIYELNKQLETPESIKEMIEACEKKHTHAFSNLAKNIIKRTQQDPKMKIVLIGGPSSSGKTTFSRRLRLELKAQNLRSVYIGMDEYFKNVSEMPRDKYGCYDFEHISALDIDLLTRDITKLLNMEKISMRHFNFMTGVGTYTEKTLELPSEDSIVVIEGIHGLNPMLSDNFAINNNNFYKVYIACLNTVLFDTSNRLITSSCRLIRRIVRDKMYRGADHHKTLRMWGSVRLGEALNILPYMKYADYCFNSCLQYEINVLKPIILNLLDQIQPHPYTEVIENEIRSMLSYFKGIENTDVPDYSILREFIGGSRFF